MLLCSCGGSTDFNAEKLVKDQLAHEKQDSVTIGACDSLLNKMRELKADTLITTTSPPKDFQQSLIQLDSMTTPEMKTVVKCLPDGDFSRMVHDNFGMYLRNNWGLWGDSELAKNLYHMGVLHPDDMTGIILDSFQRQLKGERLNLKHQINQYHEYWRKNGTPVDSILTVIRNSGNSLLIE